MKARFLHFMRSVLYPALFIAIAAFFMMILASYFFLKPYYLRASTYDLKGLEEFNVTTVFHDQSGEEIGRLFVEDRILLKHDEISNSMRQAAIAVEDRSFYSHKGIYFKGIARALYFNIKHWKCSQGGSTITQQLAKHLIGHPERTIDRKLVEVFLTLRIEKKYKKSEILDFYLNRIYLGRGYFGVGAAAKGYFGKSAKDLSVSECATLASIIKAPSLFSPRNNIEASMKRRNYALWLMASQHLLTNAEANKAVNSSLQLVPETPSRGQGYFMTVAIKELRKVLGLEDEEEIPGGLSVRTTLNAGMQRLSEIEVEKNLKEIDSVIASGRREKSPDTSELQVAALILDMNSSAIRVLIGGRNHEKSSFDRARMARRENGALLQPFVYSLAFERLHLNPASMINASYIDENSAVDPEENKLAGGQGELGSHFLMIQDALALSNAACATRVGLKLGRNNFNEWLSSTGATKSSTDSAASSTLSEPLTLYEITSLYQMMGNGGVYHRPHSIELVVDNHGEILYQEPKTSGVSLLEVQTARQMTLSLQSVTREGTASMLTQDYSFTSPVVGMTGYSAGYRDAWFVGYTPSLVAGVWIGYDKSVPIGPKSVATKTALSTWGDMMQKIMEEAPPGVAFPTPKGLSKVEVERRSGTVQGLGFMTPAPGNAFVYLRQDQVEQLHSRSPNAQVEPAKNWSDWLGTMLANPAGEKTDAASLGKQTEESNDEIPTVVKYRMPALRGNILTADGKIFATMAQSKNLVLNWPSPEIASKDNEILIWVRKRLALAQDWLKQDFGIADADLLLLHRFQRFQPILVAQNLTPVQSAAFSKTSLQGEGFSLQGIPRRIYPQSDSLAHVLGYLQRKQGRSKKQYQAEDVIYDDYQGASGLEECFDKELRGREGQVTIETTQEGFTRRALVDSEATAGASLRLTIDSKMQNAAESSLGNIRAGAVVVMNVRNGDILAMASRPTFDPNTFIPFLSAEKWQSLVQDEKKPLLDRAYRQQNPPGSSFKIVTSLAAMRAGVFDENRTVACPGYFEVGNMRYELPQERSSPVAFRSAIAHSYNTYFFDLGLRAGLNALISTARDFGIGQPLGFILPGELSGLMPDDPFVRLTHKRAMGPGDVANASVGQGDVLATPLQMAVLMSAVANGGTLFRPRLVKQTENSTGQLIKAFSGEIIRQISLPINETKILINGLVAVTDIGTAKAAQVPGVQLASKTGTAQVGSKSQPRQIAWLVGFLPAYDPQYAFVVMIEGDLDQDLHGGGDAAPIAGKLFGQIFANSSAVLTQAKK